jgi:hypothetical protein
MNRVNINREVTVTALYFQNGPELTSFPKRIEFNGREYTFLESGLRYLIQKGQQLVQIFDMTDGATNFRLRFDQNQQLWTLVDVTQQPRVMA